MEENDEIPSEVDDRCREWLLCGLKNCEEKLEGYLELNDVIAPDNVDEAELPHEEDPTVRKIDKRASIDGYLSGKWELHVAPEDVDDIWNRIKELIAKGKIWGAQVTTNWIREKQEKDEHEIRVYTPNYLDETDVLRVGRLLKDRCEIENEMSYKPDIYNVLQIYSEEGEERKLPREIRYRL